MDWVSSTPLKEEDKALSTKHKAQKRILLDTHPQRYLPRLRRKASIVVASLESELCFYFS